MEDSFAALVCGVVIGVTIGFTIVSRYIHSQDNEKMQDGIDKKFSEELVRQAEVEKKHTSDMHHLQHRYNGLKVHYKTLVQKYKELKVTHTKAKATLCKLVHRHFGEQFVQAAIQNPSPRFTQRRLSEKKLLSRQSDNTPDLI